MWVCYHDNSKLRALIFTKLGLYVKVVTVSSWINFGRPAPPGGRVKIFGSTLLQPVCSVCVPECFFHSDLCSKIQNKNLRIFCMKMLFKKRQICLQINTQFLLTVTKSVQRSRASQRQLPFWGNSIRNNGRGVLKKWISARNLDAFLIWTLKYVYTTFKHLF